MKLICTASILILSCLHLSLLCAGCGHDKPPDGWNLDGGETDGGLEQAVLEVVHVDVGQGDSTLIVGPDGTVVLVDGGPAQGSQALLDVLSARGIIRLDYVLASHPDTDHVGGLAGLIRAGIGVGRAYSEGTVADSQVFADLVAALALTEAQAFQIMEPGAVLQLGDGALATCTASGGRLIGGGRVLVSNDNDRSLGLLVSHGGFDYHVGGDLGGGGSGQADVESVLGPLVGDLDVLHLHHHGSSSSTNATWLNSTRPEVVVLSVGPNSHDHPAAEVVERLGGQDPQVLVPPPEVVQTGNGARPAGAILGTFSIRTDGERYLLQGRLREVDQ